MKTADATRTSTTVRRMAEAIIATVALIAATPAQAQPASGKAGEVLAPADGPTTNPQLPKITLTAGRDSIIAGLEDLVLTLTREGALQDSLRVTLNLTQEQEWIQPMPYTATFAAGEATVVDSIVPKGMAAARLESGNVVVTVGSVTGYDTDDATATVHMIALGGPAATAFVERSRYTFAEDDANPRMTVVARMASGMPRGADVRFTVLAFDGSAMAPQDFDQILQQVTLKEDSFVSRNGRWEARRRIRLQLIDDDVREGTEHLSFFTGLGSGDSPGIAVGDTTGAPCPACESRVEITDDEDIPDWELSVSAEEISEEEEASSTATLAITNGKTFATDQVVTFAFAGTASEDIDYTVAPEDASAEVSDHQVVLPSDSTSLAVTFTAVDDDIEDSNEEIEVSATLGGDTIGSTRTIRIVNQEVMPAITLAANRDTIIGSMENLELTLTREAPLDDALTVTVNLTQDQDWLSGLSHEVNLGVGQATATLTIAHADFSTAVTESGNLTAAVTAVAGYDTSAATATVFVVSQEGPAITVSFSQDIYRFQEGVAVESVLLIVQAAPGMPRGTETGFDVRFRNGTAESGEDFSALSQTVVMLEGGFTLQDSRWQAQQTIRILLLDDEIVEGTENFTVALEELSGSPADLQLASADAVVEITDDDSPAMELSLSADEIMEEGETSSTATVTITNGVTYATDQLLTFELGGDATPAHDYRVTPADADADAGHQVILPAGSTSVEATFTAIDDEREEGDEEITLRVTHDGSEIGSGTIHIIDRLQGPSVEITFDGVQPPRNEYDYGIATGPFTVRVTFSEPVEGFTEEDITWQTHWLTTVDSTTIGGLMWDYTEVRRGLEYTARAMPDQSGRLWAIAKPGVAKSVATGRGNRLGANSVWIDLPANRMMVAPTDLAVAEGDATGGRFIVVLGSEPTGPVTVTLSGTDGTALKADGTDFLTFEGVFWTVGRVVTVTAGHDANTTDETVTLRLTASGGGYDGQSLNVLVRVKDDDVAGGADIDDEAAAMILLEGMTPEAAAAALFGEHDLSEAQLGALDLLGNGNGRYDLGDLLSWIARCERGEASCGKTSSAAPKSVPGTAAALAAGGQRRTGHRRRRRHTAVASAAARNARARASRSRVLRRSGPILFGLALLLATTLSWGCADDVVQPPVLQPDPGVLTLQLTVPPGARDIGAMLVVEGPGIDSVSAPGLELYQSDASSSARREIIVSGALSSGSLLEVRVPDRWKRDRYRVRLLQVVAEDYTLRDLAAYSAAMSR